MGERSSKRLSFGNTSYHHRLSDGLHTFTSPFTFRPSEMTESMSQAFIADTAIHHYPLTENQNAVSKQYQNSLTTTIIMADDELVTTPTRRNRRNSVFEESLLNAGNYIKRKFSWGSSE